MPITEAQALGTGMGVLIFTTLFTIGYSIYMAVLNHKQAKVKDVVEQQLEFQVRQLNVLREILEVLKK